ncbi:TPA: hypothetical protein N0F65_000259 [Lagenidium giganteum]|uniref:PNPLA domain-containing protein n=1 Tax=Lagenidium giganteum TaxID=4803 RepID=A0AAV2Z8N1_9STRA|nr:TPA: hypothetical protein N0F65_000259 [Lagenidium giganteum]
MKLDTAAEANDRKTTTEQPSEMPEWSFSFACAGWLSLYLYGVAKAFQDHDVGQRARLIGSSAGSFAAVALALDIDLCEIRDHHLKVMAPQARDGLSGAFAVGRLTSEAIQAIRGLERFQSLNSRAFPFTVVYTSLSRGKSVRISQFDSQEHLEQCLLASSRAVPIAGLPFKLKGEWVLDGGMLDSQPLFKEGKTVTISPFHFADADIRPSRYLPPWWACYAPEPEELAWVFDLGREDGLAWIATNVPSKRVTVPSVARSSTRKWQTRCGQVVGYRMFDTAAFDALFTTMPRNVQRMLAFTFFNSTARSILAAQLLSAYLLVLTQSNAATGTVRAIQGLLEMLCSFPVAYVADRTRRDTCLRIGGVLGMVCVALLAFAILDGRLGALYVAYGLWGVFNAFATPATEALFIDSIPHGQRSLPIMIKLNVMNAAMTVGPVISIIGFLCLGNSWHMEQLQPVLLSGAVIALLGIGVLFTFQDDVCDLGKNNEPDAEACHYTTQHAKLLHTPTMIGTDLVDVPFDECDIQASQAAESQSLLGKAVDKDAAVSAVEQPVLFGFLAPQHVPYLLFLSDFITYHASGMTVNFFSVFFMQEYGIQPIQLSAVCLCQPLLVVGMSFYCRRLSLSYGRMPMVVVTRAIGISLLFCMAFAKPMWLEVVLFLLRVGFMRAPDPLVRSLVMDHVGHDARARWNALDSVVWFAFSESALLGSYIIDTYGYRPCFIVSGAIYVLGLLVDLLVLPLTRHACERHG